MHASGTHETRKGFRDYRAAEYNACVLDVIREYSEAFGTPASNYMAILQYVDGMSMATLAHVTRQLFYSSGDPIDVLMREVVKWIAAHRHAQGAQGSSSPHGYRPMHS